MTAKKAKEGDKKEARDGSRQMLVRLMQKQLDKIAKNAPYGQRNKYVRDAIDAFQS